MENIGAETWLLNTEQRLLAAGWIFGDLQGSQGKNSAEEVWCHFS
jgi:hypothetical protein